MRPDPAGEQIARDRIDHVAGVGNDRRRARLKALLGRIAADGADPHVLVRVDHAQRVASDQVDVGFPAEDVHLRGDFDRDVLGDYEDGLERLSAVLDRFFQVAVDGPRR